MKRSISPPFAGIGRGTAPSSGARVLRVALLGWLSSAAVGQPRAVAAQAPPEGVAEEVTIDRAHLESGALADRCAARSEDSDAFLAAVARARALEREEAAKAALDALEPEARRMAAEAPDDLIAQYRLAAVMGARLDHEHGREKMSGAERLRDQAARVLELDPEHPGASYMLGRIHASILRMGGFKRFMATQLFGGSALKGASWDEAQALLETAVRGDPCVPDHHFELARVYAERELAYVRELTAGRDGREARLRERAEELGRTL